MTHIFTEDWIERLDGEVRSKLKDFSWVGEVPDTPLNIVYRIRMKNGDVFSYYLKCAPESFSVEQGEPERLFEKLSGESSGESGGSDGDTPEGTNVVFSQSLETALGVLNGELNTHIEFLTGKIQIDGDVVTLESYNEIMGPIHSCLTSINTQAKI